MRGGLGAGRSASAGGGAASGCVAVSGPQTDRQRVGVFLTRSLLAARAGHQVFVRGLAIPEKTAALGSTRRDAGLGVGESEESLAFGFPEGHAQELVAEGRVPLRPPGRLPLAWPGAAAGLSPRSPLALPACGLEASLAFPAPFLPPSLGAG